MKASQIDNHNPQAKLTLRRKMLSGFNEPLDVLDCFGAKEVIWTQLKKEFQVRSYLSLDLKPRRGRFNCDSLKFLKEQTFTASVIDLDAYGEPWAHMIEVLKRGNPCLLFLTIGQPPTSAFSFLTLDLFRLPHWLPKGLMFCGEMKKICVARWLSEVYNSSLRISEAWEAPNPGGSARYIGLRLVRAQDWHEGRAGGADTTNNPPPVEAGCPVRK